MSVIVITQGDDSNALGEEIAINLDTDLDLTGCRAVFQLENFKQEFEDITSKKLLVVIPRTETKKLPCGQRTGAIKIYDKNGLAKTIVKDIKFLIEREVVDNV